MYKVIQLIFILSFLTLSKHHSASIVSSNGTGGGNWYDATSWSPESVPGCFDTISILAGDMISIDGHVDLEACPATLMLIYGNLHFPDNGWKLKLPCDSKIMGFEGGSITAPGTDNSNKISICGEWVWESSEDDVSGPFLLTLSMLPVELTNFDAEIDNTSVKLYWQTASEINNDYFTIERGTNGIHFEPLGEVSGNGNSNVANDYEFFDDSPIQGTSYYRLKQTDYNGKFEYLKLIAVDFNQDDDGICTLHVYPNPCVGSCTINLEDCPLADNEVDIELYDALGKKISNRITPKDKNQDISFHMNTSNNLSPGVYIVRSNTGGRNQASKVIVK